MLSASSTRLQRPTAKITLVAAVGFVQLAAQRLARSGGAALVIDYGADAPPADSLRGILRHQFVHPLHAPGEVDLSTDVDFGALRAVAAADAPTLPDAPVLRRRHRVVPPPPWQGGVHAAGALDRVRVDVADPLCRQP